MAGGGGFLLPSRFHSSSEVRPPSLSLASLIPPPLEAFGSASNPLLVVESTLFLTTYDIRNTMYDSVAGGGGFLLPSRFHSSSEVRPPSLSLASLIPPPLEAFGSASNPLLVVESTLFLTTYDVRNTMYDSVAGGGGFEPPLRDPEPRGLPLADPPIWFVVHGS